MNKFKKLFLFFEGVKQNSHEDGQKNVELK